MHYVHVLYVMDTVYILYSCYISAMCIVFCKVLFHRQNRTSLRINELNGAPLVLTLFLYIVIYVVLIAQNCFYCRITRH